MTAQDKYKVKRNVPMPKPKLGSSKLLRTMKEMKSGDFIYIGDIPAIKIRQQAYVYAKRLGIQIKTRKLNDGIGVWVI